mgnify:CR=1 FL=1
MGGMSNISGIGFAEILSGARRIAIAVHSHPDGDAVGSGAALLHFIMETLGGKAALTIPDSIPDNLSFIIEGLPGDSVLFHDRDPENTVETILKADMIVCLDMNAFNRSGALEEALSASGAKKILVDHHLNPDTGAFDVVFSDTRVSSTCELLFRILMETEQVGSDASRLPGATATALMAGMTTDTNNFANSVFPGTLDMASSLLAAGVDRDAIVNNIYRTYRENRIRLMGFLLDKCLSITSSGVAYMILDKETMSRFGITEGETEGFVNIPLSIGKVRMSIFLREDNGFFRVSVRSKEGTSANSLAMKYFNGGGHELAAGGKLFFPSDIPSREDAASYIVRVTGNFLEGK